MNAISLGVVGHDGLPRRAARNEMWKHAGAIFFSANALVLIKDASGFFRFLDRVHIHSRGPTQ